MAEELLQEIIASPHHEQLVARLEGIIVGAATLSIIMGPAVKREGYLSDFVADPNIIGARIGHKIWEEMIRWCEEHNIDLVFTSRPTRIKSSYVL
jgi:acetyltransferase (GNAT) family protein